MQRLLQVPKNTPNIIRMTISIVLLVSLVSKAVSYGEIKVVTDSEI